MAAPIGRMRRSAAAALVLTFLAATHGAAGDAPGTGDSVTVGAAISLTEVLTELGQRYQAKGGGPVVASFAGSNVIARQIANGAPVDLFISADELQLAVVERAGLIDRKTCVTLVRNRLAVVVRADHPDPPAAAASLAAGGVRRIAVGNPEAVPAGVYAKQYLERMGLWTAVEPKLLPAASVRAAMAAVVNGAADAGIVYVTDVRGSQALRVAAVIEGPEAPRIAYPACVISSSRRKDAARAFLRFLQTPPASEVFTRYGFEPVPLP